MSERICPVWMGYLLASPIRKLFQDPSLILQKYVEPGMTVVEVGPGMGFFSIPMAKMVGLNGRIICVDVQQGMLDRLRKRALKSGVQGQIETRVCPPDSLGIQDVAADFALLFAVVHEVPDQEKLFRELAASLNPGATVLFAEPKGHVTDDAFAASLSRAAQYGLMDVDRPTIKGSLAALLRKN